MVHRSLAIVIENEKQQEKFLTWCVERVPRRSVVLRVCFLIFSITKGDCIFFHSLGQKIRYSDRKIR